MRKCAQARNKLTALEKLSLSCPARGFTTPHLASIGCSSLRIMDLHVGTYSEHGQCRGIVEVTGGESHLSLVYSKTMAELLNAPKRQPEKSLRFWWRDVSKVEVRRGGCNWPPRGIYTSGAPRGLRKGWRPPCSSY